MQTDLLILLVSVTILGSWFTFFPRHVCEINIRYLESMPYRPGREANIAFFRSLKARLIFRGVGIGILIWVALAIATIQ
jgi:hypothetical protein